MHPHVLWWEKYWAGQMDTFLSHAPPGWEDCHPSEEAHVAEVARDTDEMTILAISGQ